MQEAKKFNPSPIDRRQKLLILLIVTIFYGFLFFQLSNFAKADWTPSPKLYSKQAQDDLKGIYLNTIDNAKKSIYLEIFGLNDKTVIKRLNQKAESGIPVYIKFDPTGSPALLNKLSPKIVAVPIVLSGLMHRKILIIDDEFIIAGTANLTTSSLIHHDNVVATVADKNLSYFIKTATSKYFSARIQGQTLDFFLLPEKKRFCSSQIEQYIHTAQKTIKVAMFTLTHKELTQALASAAQRGVKVQVALDLQSTKGSSSKSALLLHEAKVPLIFNNGKHLLHHKWALIDDKIFIMGSANWTKSAFIKNQDFVLIIDPINEEQKAKLDRIWQTLEEEKHLSYTPEKTVA